MEAILGEAIVELLVTVVQAIKKVSSFQHILTRLESTLVATIPRLDEISRLNDKLDLQQQGMKELAALASNGKELVLKCSKISSINLVKKMQYSKELLDLDNNILRYFMTTLPLDNFRDTKEILLVVKELQMKLVGNKDGGICNQLCSEPTGQPKKDLGNVVKEAMKSYQDCKNEEAVKFSTHFGKKEAANKDSKKQDEVNSLHQDSRKEKAVNLFNDFKKEFQMKLVGDKDKGICNRSEPGKEAKEDLLHGVQEPIKLYQDPKKEEAINLFGENYRGGIKEGCARRYAAIRSSKKKEAVNLFNDSKKELQVKLLGDEDEGICNRTESGKSMKVSGSGLQYGMKSYQAIKGEVEKSYQDSEKEEAMKFKPKYEKMKRSGKVQKEKK